MDTWLGDAQRMGLLRSKLCARDDTDSARGVSNMKDVAETISDDNITRTAILSYMAFVGELKLFGPRTILTVCTSAIRQPFGSYRGISAVQHLNDVD